MMIKFPCYNISCCVARANTVPFHSLSSSSAYQSLDHCRFSPFRMGIFAPAMAYEYPAALETLP
jgi:hypothetical protein